MNIVNEAPCLASVLKIKQNTLKEADLNKCYLLMDFDIFAGTIGTYSVLSEFKQMGYLLNTLNNNSLD